jgi:pimeloyl-ACP methyl ester carboxylesterase
MHGVAAAQHRAMPFTRLIDYGMDHADARRLLDDTATGSAWQDVARTVGAAQLDRAASALREGYLVTAGEALEFAAAAFMFEQMAHEQDDEAKRAAYGRHLEAISSLATLRPDRMERVEVEFRNGQLSGWLTIPPRSIGTVIVWGGLSGWGAAFLQVAKAYNRRGVACLLAEGPGQGLPRLEYQLWLDVQVVEGFARFVDIVESDPRLNGPIAVHGNSFGGLYAAHLASRDGRVRACVVNGAPPNPDLPEFHTAVVQMTAAMGNGDTKYLTSVLDALAFDPIEHPIHCPLMVLSGESDPLAPSKVQRPFCEAGAQSTTRLVTWPDGEHTLYNHAAERDAVVGDWIVNVMTHAGDSANPATSRPGATD